MEAANTAAAAAEPPSRRATTTKRFPTGRRPGRRLTVANVLENITVSKKVRAIARETQKT